MKSTEPLDGTRKSLDLSSATDATASPESALVSDAKRRRLVRGAVALAPLVLTLRSGALAAASCTGAKTVETTIGDDGKPGVGVETDVCIPNAQVCSTPDYQGYKLETIQGTPGNPILPNGTCGFPPGTKVAILSSHAYQSMNV